MFMKIEQSPSTSLLFTYSLSPITEIIVATDEDANRKVTNNKVKNDDNWMNYWSQLITVDHS